MDEEERDHIGRLLREAAKKDRGYASFHDWPDREQKEVGVVLDLFESLVQREGKGYSGLHARGQGNDPPDCEAVDSAGCAIGIEVTELVDPVAIRNYKSGRIWETAEWNRDKFMAFLSQRIRKKDEPAELRGGPYCAYWLVIHCDEPALSVDRVEAFLTDAQSTTTKLIDEVFLLLSYVPRRPCYPYYRVPIARAAVALTRRPLGAG